MAVPLTAQQLLIEAGTCESKIKPGYSMNPQTSVLRSRIKDAYLALISLDQGLAEEKQVERNLWKYCFHMQIEELRKHLRTAAKEEKQGKKGSPERHARLKKYFRNLLRTAKEFYDTMMRVHSQKARIQSNKKANGFATDLLAGHPFTSIPTYNRQSMFFSLLTCHRSLIYLGDLERYYQSNNVGAPSWEKAKIYYQQALMLFAGSGNPYNQLAVVACYVNQYLAATHFYFRSLFVKKNACSNALHNLNVILVKNRSLFCEALQNRIALCLSQPSMNRESLELFLVALYGWLIAPGLSLSLYIYINVLDNAFLFRRYKNKT